MLITRHASRLILGRPLIRLDDIRPYDSDWTCGCRGRTIDSATLEVEWCDEHGQIFDDADLKLQA